jgi:hypothetical protein
MAVTVDYELGAYKIDELREDFIDLKGKWEPAGNPAKSVFFNQDSSDEYMDITGAGVSLGEQGAASVSAWVYIDDLSAINTVFSATNQGTNNKLTCEINTSGEIGARVQPADGQVEVFRGSSGSASPISTGSWRHCVWCINVAGDDIDLYLDGVLLSNSNPGFTLTSWSTEETATRLGQRHNGTNPLKGMLDEIVVFNKFLSGAEVTELYNSGSAFHPFNHSAATNIMHYWQMGDGDTHPTISDITGNQDGTLTNTEETDIVDGVYQVPEFTGLQPYTSQRAIRFNNGGDTNESLTITGIGAGLNGVSEISISQWLNITSITTFNNSFHLGDSFPSGKRIAIEPLSGRTIGVTARARSGDASQTATTTGIVFSLNTWFHLVYVVDLVNDVMKLYINGSDEPMTATPSFANTTFDATEDTSHIGRQSDGDGDYRGLIADTAVFHKALTSTEVTEIYNGGATFNLKSHSAASDLQYWYKFGDGVGDTITTIIDQQGNQNAPGENLDAGDIEVESP